MLAALFAIKRRRTRLCGEKKETRDQALVISIIWTGSAIVHEETLLKHFFR
jgi:hypothetical protein